MLGDELHPRNVGGFISISRLITHGIDQVRKQIAAPVEDKSPVLRAPPAMAAERDPATSVAASMVIESVGSHRGVPEGLRQERAAGQQYADAPAGAVG